MSNSTSKPQHLHLHVGTTSATAATATATNGSAASPGSSSSSHHSPRAPHRTPNAAGEIGSGQISSACAACKYQRRRCTRDCLLAPYFPADHQRRFLHAQRLFGVSNLQKTLKRIEPKYGPDAMRSLIYEAEARAADPVGGCVGIIEELNRQIHNTQMELQFVRQQIAICRQASATDGVGLSDPAAAAMILPAPYPGQQDDMTAAVAAICAPQQPSGDLRHDPSSHQKQLYHYFCYNNGAAGDEATSDDDDRGMQQYGFADVVDSSVKAAGLPAVALGEQLEQHCQIQALPFVDAFGVKPQVLPPPATIQHHGPAAAGDVLHPGQQKLMTPFLEEHDDDVDEHDEDEHMEEQQATAGAPCHLELGFSSSSSFYNA